MRFRGRAAKDRPMSIPFPSEEWANAFGEAVNQNEDYQKHGKPWTFGDVAMIVRAEPEAGVPEEAGMVLDVHEGRCRGVQYLVGEGKAKAAFEIIAPYATWKEVIEGKLDPIAAMMQGKLDLRTGHLPTMIRFVESSRALVKSAAAVPTEFPS